MPSLFDAPPPNFYAGSAMPFTPMDAVALARDAARYIAPSIYGIFAGEAPPPPPNADIAPVGKVGQTHDPRFASAGAEFGNILSNFVGPGGGMKSVGLAGLAVLPMAARVGKSAAKLPLDDVARLTRADEAGFLRNMPVYASTAPEGERIAAKDAAAIRVGEQLFTGPRHLDAIDKAERHFGKTIDELEPMMPPFPDGFVTTSGRYVTRHEAADIANAAGQSSSKSAALPAWAGLSSEGLISGKISAPGSPGAPPPTVAATHPGLPGGEGVWLALEPGPGTGAQLWHRAERTKRGAADVEGLSVPEIHATLRNAWDSGKEAVLLKNYTTPDGKIQNVLVVKDRAQLRDPQAKFDPDKRHMPDLSAAIIPPVAAGAALPEFLRREQ